MSDFLTSHKPLMLNEGGYANNPKDRGKETYKGISRNKHPNWSGWRYIDGLKSQLVKQPEYGTSAWFSWVRYFNQQAEKISGLQSAVLEFYQTTFWKRLGEIDSQDLATWVYDKDVNTGSLGTQWLQKALGVKVDGDLGSKTISAANSAVPEALLDTMKELAKEFYLHRAQKPGQAGFWESWIARVGLSPERLAQANSEARNLGIIS